MGISSFSFVTQGISFSPRSSQLFKRIHFNSLKMTSYTTEARGSLNTNNYRLFFKDENGKVVSPFHDIPMLSSNDESTFHMVVEVPRWTNAKMEIDTKSKLNPIKQDIKNDKLRYVNNCFPHHGYIWNYGAIPQTWEDPNHLDPNTNCKGDNDPIDACEIGQTVHKQGAVVSVKVLGIMALIDEGETDWKVLCIDTADPLADKLNDVQDIDTHMPGFLRATYEWFKIYKMPTGKPPNEFAFNGEAKNKEFAVDIIKQTHKQWQSLLNKSVDGGSLACENVKVVNSPFNISAEDAQTILDSAPSVGTAEEIPSEVDKWFYVTL